MAKFVRRAYSRRVLDCKKTTVLCFLPSWRTLLFERDYGGKMERFDVAARSETLNPIWQSHKQRRLRYQVKKRTPEQRTANTEPISKKKNTHQINTKTVRDRKVDCAWGCSRWQTQPEKTCKLHAHSTYQRNVRNGRWFVRCNLQIFSGWACHLEQLHARSPFLFPIVFFYFGVKGALSRYSVIFCAILLWGKLMQLSKRSALSKCPVCRLS